jgi:hypothetical protein
MSAIDSCEPSVNRAFEKDGWRLLAKPYSLPIEARRFVYADFSIERGVNGSSEQFLVVEVKCFTKAEDDLVELYRAIGQYLHHLEMYRLSSPDGQVFAVGAVTTSGEYPAAIVVQARMAGDIIIIDADNTDRPPFERLMAEGIPREKIIRAYTGEEVSHTSQP